MRRIPKICLRSSLQARADFGFPSTRHRPRRDRPDHGWWDAQLVEPYVTEHVTWAIRYHEALRVFPDSSVGYGYPEMYVQMFGKDYKPAAYQEALAHRWYLTAPINLDPFMEIIALHFKQPAEGLGNDNSPTAHMWRTFIDPGKLL